jgi:phosphoglycerate-specific signal transduction histidine kinase
MQETMNVQSITNDRKPSQPSVGENVSEELTRLRDELSRTAHSLRMKSKGASAEVQDTRRMLEREAKRFSAEVGEAVERTQEDLIQAGKDLRMRFQKVASQIVLPPS